MTIALARNDGSLAYGLARQHIAEEYAQMISSVRSSAGKYKNPLKMLRKSFGKFIIHENVTRPNGSRQKWILTLIVPNRKGDLELRQCNMANSVMLEYFIGEITRHAVARIFTRHLAGDDMAAFRETMLPFIKVFAKLVNKGTFNDRNGTLRMATATGLLIAEIEEHRFVMKTFIDEEDLKNPEHKPMMDELKRKDAYAVVDYMGDWEVIEQPKKGVK